MRAIASAILVAAATVAGIAPASAQQDIARELERKARAGEQDGGYCARAGRGLAKLTREQLAERLHVLLARPDQARASLVFVVTDRPDGEPACTYFAFEPVTTRDGKKCRPAHVFVCIAGQDCRADFDHAICELRPGKWG
jgi:hypothetical protein